MEDSIQKEEQRRSADNKNRMSRTHLVHTEARENDPGTISKMKLTEQLTVLTFLWKEILDYWEKVWT